MTAPDLLKLAPNLSAEERYKIIFADLLGQMDGEPARLSDSELQAMLRFESRAVWQEYALHAAMMRHANAIWIKEIETEKLRSYALYLHLSYQFQIVVMDDDAPKTKKAERFAAMKKSTADIHKSLVGFYAYREAIPKLEAILYGVPFFNKETRASVAAQFALIESTIRHHNEGIRGLCECHDAKQFIKPIVEDIESYLIREAVPSEEDVNELVDFVKKMAESEIRHR